MKCGGCQNDSDGNVVDNNDGTVHYICYWCHWDGTLEKEEDGRSS